MAGTTDQISIRGKSINHSRNPTENRSPTPPHLRRRGHGAAINFPGKSERKRPGDWSKGGETKNGRGRRPAR
ncbi:hypothetical protein GWI33_016410 [Rhynchophorus ferrugineus]|uniref:Uncharacterized protein n=1 Tax=Rhynchophorus ferrugineus TaxID=354439 RepID=A0A834M4Z7_RHYFE|nr:hypothetical protein GWI33_016410 [Rhynchophorus ferrugineus]